MDKFTSRDPNQTIQAEHDENQNAKRVTIVGGDFGIAEALKESFKDLKLEMPKYNSYEVSADYPNLKAPQFWPNEIEKQVLVKEYEVLKVPEIVIKYEKIEIPVTVFETKIVEIEKPIYIEKVKIEKVETQVIVREVVNIDKMFKLFLLGQTISTLIYLFGLFYGK